MIFFWLILGASYNFFLYSKFVIFRREALLMLLSWLLSETRIPVNGKPVQYYIAYLCKKTTGNCSCEINLGTFNFFCFLFHFSQI